MFQQCFKPTTLRFATYVHQFSSAKLWSHVEGSFLETMRMCTSWWSKFDSWQFDFICDNPNQESLTLWQWWNHCLSMIRSGLIAPGVLHLDSIINYHVMRRQTPHLKTVAAPSDSSWWFRSSMEVGDTDHIRWRCQFFKFFQEWTSSHEKPWRWQGEEHLASLTYSKATKHNQTYSTYLVARRHFDKRVVARPAGILDGKLGCTVAQDTTCMDDDKLFLIHKLIHNSQCMRIQGVQTTLTHWHTHPIALVNGFELFQGFRSHGYSTRLRIPEDVNSKSWQR